MTTRPNLAQLRETLKLKDRKKPSADNGPDQDETTLKFWNMEVGQETIVRLLQDADEDNQNLFYITLHEHWIPKPDDSNKKVKHPCGKNDDWEGECQYCAAQNTYYKANNKELAYVFKRTTHRLVLVYVVSDPVKPENDGKVFKCYLSRQIYEVLDRQIDLLLKEDDKSNIFDGKGFNFILRKTKQGEYANYMASDFARRETTIPKQKPIKFKELI